LTHLIARGRFRDAEELILFVGSDPGNRETALRAGFGFQNISDSDLISRFGVEAAPVLVIFNSNGELRYAGGYYNHPATIRPLDEQIHGQLEAGKVTAALPVFGCAVSLRLQRSLDPLRRTFSQ